MQARRSARTAADRLNEVCMSADACEQALYDAIARDDASVVALLCRGAAPDASYAAPEVQARLMDVNLPLVRNRAHKTLGAPQARDLDVQDAEQSNDTALAARLRGMSLAEYVLDTYGKRPLQVAMYNLSSDAARVLVACGAQPIPEDYTHLTDGIQDHADAHEDAEKHITQLLALLQQAGVYPAFRHLYSQSEVSLLSRTDDEFWRRTLETFRARPEAIVTSSEKTCATREMCDQILVSSIRRNAGMAIRAMCVAGVLPNLNQPVTFVDEETGEDNQGLPLEGAFYDTRARAALALVECGAQQYEGMAGEFTQWIQEALGSALTPLQVVRVQQDADALVRVLRAAGVPNVDSLSARANQLVLKRAQRSGSRRSQAGQSRRA